MRKVSTLDGGVIIYETNVDYETQIKNTGEITGDAIIVYEVHKNEKVVFTYKFREPITKLLGNLASATDMSENGVITTDDEQKIIADITQLYKNREKGKKI